MPNERTTYGEVVDLTLARVFGDQRVSELNCEVLDLLKRLGIQGAVWVGQDQPVRRAAAMLMLAAGYVSCIGEDNHALFEMTLAGRVALARMSA